MPSPIPLSLICIFATAALAPVFVRFFKAKVGWFLALAPLLAFSLLISGVGEIAGGQAIVYEAKWFEALGVNFIFRMDGLSLLMASLITLIGACILVYAGGYLKGHPQLGRFFLYLLSFMGAMLGLVLSDNLLLLFVFWELTSITSYLLIGFKHEYAESRWNALQALLVTGAGAMAMLAGFILLYQITGTFLISEINLQGATIAQSPIYIAAIICILAGAFTKSAQFPFHFWLPNAMAGPTPVSAYLHSATMVKAGIFLMARLNPALSQDPLWGQLLCIFGAVTFLMAVSLGLLQRDIKRILAYTTLSVLGLLTFLLGIGTEYAIKAMIVFLFGHSLYKATLFMVAGNVDHEAGTRDGMILRGLRKAMPITAAAGALAALSMSGMVPFFGFIAKELIYKSTLAIPELGWLLVAIAFIGSVLMMALALSVGFSPFWGQGEADDLPKKPHEAPASMWLGPVILSGAGLILGVAPFLVSGPILGPAIAATYGVAEVKANIAIWQIVKPNLALLLSILTLALGFAAYTFRFRYWKNSNAVLKRLRPLGMEAVYDRIFYGTVRLAKFVTRRLQTGYLHDYVFMIVLTSSGFLLWAIVNFGGLDFSMNMAEYDLVVIGVTLIMMVAAIVAVSSSTYITVLVALGVIGFGVALLFAYYGAPDLAITQLLVEVLTVTLFMFVILKLPPLKHLSLKKTRIRDGILASGFGSLITVLVLKAVNIQFDHTISAELARLSYIEAKGRNIVNVILVDFRALDTLGEVVVIAAAALGIAALVKSRPLKKRKG